MRTSRCVVLASVVVGVVAVGAAVPASGQVAGHRSSRAVSLAPVTKLRVAAATRTTIRLRWSDPKDKALRHVVVRRGTGLVPPSTSKSGVAVATLSRAATSVTVTHLAPGHKYGFAVFTRGGSSGSSGSRTTVLGLTAGKHVITALAVAEDNDCLLFSDGTASCLGDGPFVGNKAAGSFTARPLPVTGLSDAIALAAGGTAVCALRYDGTAVCWGNDQFGQLGDGTTATSRTQRKVVGLTHLVAIGGGLDHACAVRVDGTVWCWGRNNEGQLGDGSEKDSDRPVEVRGIKTATSVAGGFEATCARLSTGHVDCWGMDTFGQLGDGRTFAYSAVPVQVSGISNALSVTMGAYFSCARLHGGAAACWGSNDDGELGDGGTSSRSTPSAVVGLTGASTVSASAGTGCALVGTHPRCWGYNGQGGVGNGDEPNDSKVPSGVARLTHVTMLTSGTTGGSSCALQSNIVYCWGYDNYGQVGTTKDSLNTDVPVEVTHG